MQKVEYKFFVYDTDQTLVLSNPAEIRFINTGTGGNIAVINQVFKLQTLTEFIAGTSVYPYEFNLKINQNEIDVTQYQIKFQGGGVPRLYVLIKYYVK